MKSNRIKSVLKKGCLQNTYHYVQKLYYLRIFAGRRLHQCKKAMKTKKKGNLKTIFFLGEAVWKNLGDQAQTYCIEKWLHEYYKGYQICILSHYEINNPYFDFLSYFEDNIQRDDLIFFQSGYQTTDLFEGVDITPQSQHQMHRMVVQRFHNNKIVFMPQTVNFISPIEAKKTAEIYNRHPNLTFMARDQLSYQTAQELFSKCQVLCVPDIVNILIGNMVSVGGLRQGILFCMRESDKESNHSEQVILALRKKIKTDILIETDMIDTSIDVRVATLIKHRDHYIRQMIDHFSHKKLIITNRYHGVVFAMAANTPVIVLPTRDHKVTGGIKLYPAEFEPYLYVAHSDEEVMNLASQILSQPDRRALSAVMLKDHYQHLKEQIKL